VKGRCHLCRRVKDDLAYCGDCDHYFCLSCRNRWFWRGWEFVKQLASGRRAECCGPVEEKG
jgi:hypothetical protein